VFLELISRGASASYTNGTAEDDDRQSLTKERDGEGDGREYEGKD